MQGRVQAEEAEAFISLLLASPALEKDRIYVTLTMRTEYLGECVRFLDLPDAINRSQYLVPRLTRTQLEAAIRGPAQVFGGDVAPVAVTEMINAITTDRDQLPILQHALARTWEVARQRAPEAPRIEAHDVVGVTNGAALSRHANEVLAGVAVSPESRQLVSGMFRAITGGADDGARAHDLRRPRTLVEIARDLGREDA